MKKTTRKIMSMALATGILGTSIAPTLSLAETHIDTKYGNEIANINDNQESALTELTQPGIKMSTLSLEEEVLTRKQKAERLIIPDDVTEEELLNMLPIEGSEVVKEGTFINNTQGVASTYKIYDDGTMIVEASGSLSDIGSTYKPGEEYNDLAGRIIITGDVTSIGAYSLQGYSGYWYNNGPKRERLAEIYIMGDIKTVKDNALASKSTSSGFSRVHFSDKVTNIGYRSLYSTYHLPLKKISGMKNVTTIGAEAFSRLTSLESIPKLDNIQSIGNKAFYDNRKITNIQIGENLKTIGNEAFCEMNLLSEINLSEGLTHIGTSAFQKTNISKLTLPSTVTSIGGNAFYQTPLKEIINHSQFPQTIGEGAFSTQPGQKTAYGHESNHTFKAAVQAAGYLWKDMSELPAEPPTLPTINVPVGSQIYDINDNLVVDTDGNIYSDGQKVYDKQSNLYNGATLDNNGNIKDSLG